MEKPKISACLVIHNEENLLPRCLESLEGVVDEIIVVHDGECSDSSLQIAAGFGTKVFTRELIGEAEQHRPFSYEQASGDWILQIDADEYLSTTAIESLPGLVCSEDTDAYAFWWPYWDGSAYFKNGPFSKELKPCLFRKSKMYIVGITHEYPRTLGIIRNLPEVQLRHEPSYVNFSKDTFRRKWVVWAKLRAKQIKNLEAAPKFHISNMNSNPVINYYVNLRRFPLLYAFWEPFKFLLIYLRRGLLFSGIASIKTGFWLILFRFYQNLAIVLD